MKEEKSEVQTVLEQWQEELKSIPAPENSHFVADNFPQARQNHYDDEDVPPPPVCFSVDESENAESVESVALAAANALRGVELRSRDTNLQPDDQASVYDKASVGPEFSLQLVPRIPIC